MTDWHPIETAPRDGTRILLFDGLAVGEGCWLAPYGHADKAGWAWGHGDEAEMLLSANGPVTATHWMPLPEPPVSKIAIAGRG